VAIVLIGFMGAGKSTAAVELGAALGQRTFDSDTLLAERFGHPVATEFELHGEAAFRAAEEQLVCELLDDAAPEDVIALGGGSVLSLRVREALGRGHLTVLLEVDHETAWSRVAGDGSGPARPLAADPGAFARLHAERAPLYEQLAGAIISGLGPADIERVALHLRVLLKLPETARLLWARSASGDYPVLIGDGLLAEYGASLVDEGWPIRAENSRSFCVSDENVAPLLAGHLGEIAATIAIRPGESSKTLRSAEMVWGELVAAGATRADRVLALGGGVVGDLAGFCAGTYQRGLPVIQIPTTLVAQVDSAYGGKTGVDLPDAKNYVGVYHQPAGVLTDPAVLASLPAQELAAGWVEVLKTALIAGGALWESVQNGAVADRETIFACARTKLATVAADERDGGRRQVLNLGHTVGHAIETATGYASYRHGEAVGLGLLAALRLSGQDDLRAQVAAMLQGHGLPVELRGAEVDEVLAALRRDKKRIGAEVPFVLVDAPGAVVHGRTVPDADLKAAVTELIA
jgi:shikimate kinase/3-dehydroquinate synthase